MPRIHDFLKPNCKIIKCLENFVKANNFGVKLTVFLLVSMKDSLQKHLFHMTQVFTFLLQTGKTRQNETLVGDCFSRVGLDFEFTEQIWI